MKERLSHHAATRALERLQLGRHSFMDWCRATRNSWIPVNPEFLRARNLRANSHHAHIYVTPFTADLGVALIVGDNGVIATVMTFPQTARLVAEAASYPAAPGRV